MPETAQTGDKTQDESNASNASNASVPVVSWVYKLTKNGVIEKLKERGQVVDVQASIDKLRKELVSCIRNRIPVKPRVKCEVCDLECSRVGEQLARNLEQKNSKQENSTMDVAKRLSFKLNEDDWESFSERLEIYFETQETPDAKKTGILLMLIDNDAYMLVRDLCAPAKPKQKTFTELVEIIQQHLAPKPSEAMERCKFHQTVQSATETVAEFSARLKKMSLHCNFAEVQTALRDQLVCGLRDHETKITLFKENALTYEGAYKIAVAHEEAAKNATKVESIAKSTAGIQNINYVRAATRGRGFSRGRGNPGRGRSRGQRAGLRGEYKQEGTDNGKERPNTQTNNEEIKCYCCGKPGHYARGCIHQQKTCSNCQRKGHLAAACWEPRGAGHQSVRYLEETEEAEGEDFDDGDRGDEIFHLRAYTTSQQAEEKNVYSMESRPGRIVADPMYVCLKIDKVPVRMQVDGGTFLAVMSEQTKQKLLPRHEVEQTPIALEGYGYTLPPVGVLKNLKVEYEGLTKWLDCYVVPAKGPTLIGRQWLAAFGEWPLGLKASENNEKKINSISLTSQVKQVQMQIAAKYPLLFGKGPGLFNKGSVKIVLKENAKPVALKARHVPFALQEKVEKEINILVGLGHLEKVEISEWATPIVPIVKSDGSVRICGNFKLTLNPQLVIDKYPLPTIDEIFAALQGGQTFSQVDLKHAYMQIPIEEASRHCLTITTHKGLFTYTRLPEGVASGPGVFQRQMETCVSGIPRVKVYLDNLYCTGNTESEHRRTLEAVLTRLEECGLRANAKKCDFFKDEIEILGFVIDRNGLHKSPAKVKAMIEAPRPQDAKQLAAFIGLITYYGRFLPLRAQHMKSLYECLRQSEFCWSDECEKEFKWIKTELASEKVLAHYDPKEQLILACDASAYGLSAILSHRYRDGSERPIEYGSKIIPKDELNRAIIDKEASAIVFGFKKYYQYVYGREVILRTDHKPLLYIFGPKKEIPVTIASRLQRWSYFLSGFNYRIEYIKSEENSNCDALSRLPIENEIPVFDRELTAIRYISEGLDVLDFRVVAAETTKDKVLKEVAKFVREGWPPSEEKLGRELKPYFARRLELTLDQNCIMWGHRVVVPERLKQAVMRELHASHLGIVKTKMLARSYVWWPGVDGDIEIVVTACVICGENRNKPAKVQLTPWPWPDRAWSRIHCDFLGPFEGRMFLVVIDSHSKWPEVVDFGNCTTAARLIVEFRNLFARFGLPRHLVSDNGRQFASEEFGDFLKLSGIKHSFSPPYHPATNGAAENFVNTFKTKVKKIVKEGKSLHQAIDIFLFDYRSTPHSTTGKTPAWLVYKRELRTRFDLLKPSLHNDIELKQVKQIEAKMSTRSGNFAVGDAVWAEDHRRGDCKQAKATVSKILSPVTFEVQVAPNLTWKRHANQLRRRTAIEERVVKESEEVQSKVDSKPETLPLRRSARLNKASRD